MLLAVIAPSTSLRSERSFVDESGQPFSQDAFCFCRNAVDNFSRWQDLVNESCILAHRKDRFVYIAVLSGGQQRCMSFRPILTQRPFPPCPSFDEAVAP